NVKLGDSGALGGETWISELIAARKRFSILPTSSAFSYGSGANKLCNTRPSFEVESSCLLMIKAGKCGLTARRTPSSKNRLGRQPVQSTTHICVRRIAAYSFWLASCGEGVSTIRCHLPGDVVPRAVVTIAPSFLRYFLS